MIKWPKLEAAELLKVLESYFSWLR